MRTKRYLPLKFNFSLQSRVIIANVFLLPLLSFVFRFFLMPTLQQKQVCKIITEWLGLANRYTFDQLTTHRRNGGLHHPLHNVNQLNLAAILSNLPEAPTMLEAKLPPKISSLCISKHISAAAAKFFAITDTKPTPETCQQNLSKTLHLNDDTPLRALAKKLNPADPEKTIGREAATSLATTITKNAQALPASLPRDIRNHIFKLIHNALPTKMRDRFYPENLGKNTSCSFCQEQPETIAHLHLCQAAMQARGLIAQKTLDRSSITILHSATPDDFTLKTSNIPPRDQLTLTIFSLACWRARQHIRHSPPTDEEKTTAAAAHAIASSFLRLRKQVLKKTTRKAKDRTNARQQFLRKLSALPPQSMHVYTDGSCFRSEKKAGAGVYLANFASATKMYLSFPLGDASNNVAELEGILKAIQYLLPRAASLSRVYFFVDNKYAINVSTKVWKAKCHRPLVRQIHLALTSLQNLTQVFFLWVPAHAKIYGNEVAITSPNVVTRLPPFPLALQTKNPSTTSSHHPRQLQALKIACPPRASAPSNDDLWSSLARRHLERAHARTSQTAPGMLVSTTPSTNLQRRSEPLLAALMGPFLTTPSISQYAAKKPFQKLLPYLRVKHLNFQICRPKTLSTT